MNNMQVLDLIERIGNLLRAEQRKIGTSINLQPIHLQVLDYLDRCNKYSNIPVGVVKYFGITKGTASQTLKVLEKKLFIRKRPDPADKRSVHLIITAKGKNALNKFSNAQINEQIRNLLDSESSDLLNNSLMKILSHLQRQNSYKTFGVCKTCRHLISYDDDKYRCGITGESLTGIETTKICHEHQYLEEANQ